MNELYVVQCHDDPYCAPYAATICETLEAAIQASQGQDDFCYIELFVKQGNCFKSAKRLFNEKGQEIDSMGLRKYNVGDDVDMITSDDDFDDEIAEALRLAGVELDEAEATLPTPIDQETLYANKEAEKNEDLAPEYNEVDTTPFSKDASEGFKLTLEAAVKTDKVKKIYETAKSMYAKKDVSDWMTLDRRYMTKLIKEGVGYEKANKILTSAKKGK